MKVAILLATYNSGPYLKDLLDSILVQSFRDWTLYVSDDGSQDGTWEVLTSYSYNFPNIVLLNDVVVKRGPKDRFMWMLESVESDYYLFADHDDVWCQDKLMIMVNRIVSLEKLFLNRPIVVHSDLIVVDSSLNVIDGSFWKYSGINVRLLTNFNYLAVTNGLTGCAMILNASAKTVSLPISIHGTMHDAWISLSVSANSGVIDYVNIPTVFYRQHNSNAIGAMKVGGIISYVKRALTNWNKLIEGNLARFRMANAIKRFSLFRYFIFKVTYLVLR